MPIVPLKNSIKIVGVIYTNQQFKHFIHLNLPLVQFENPLDR